MLADSDTLVRILDGAVEMLAISAPRTAINRFSNQRLKKLYSNSSTLLDRLLHHVDVTDIEGDSYRVAK